VVVGGAKCLAFLAAGFEHEVVSVMDQVLATSIRAV
jgi:hypothetical protein